MINIQGFSFTDRPGYSVDPFPFHVTDKAPDVFALVLTILQAKHCTFTGVADLVERIPSGAIYTVCLIPQRKVGATD